MLQHVAVELKIGPQIAQIAQIFVLAEHDLLMLV